MHHGAGEMFKRRQSDMLFWQGTTVSKTLVQIASTPQQQYLEALCRRTAPKPNSSNERCEGTLRDCLPLPNKQAGLYDERHIILKGGYRLIRDFNTLDLSHIQQDAHTELSHRRRDSLIAGRRGQYAVKSIFQGDKRTTGQ